MIAGKAARVSERLGRCIYEITQTCDTMADGDMMQDGGKCLIEFYDYLRRSGKKRKARIFRFLFYDIYEVINGVCFMGKGAHKG